MTYKAVLWQVFYLSKAPSPYYLLLHTVHVYTLIQDTYSHREGGGRRANQREGDSSSYRPARPGIDPLESIPGLLKNLKIRALYSARLSLAQPFYCTCAS
jgi:hypothetical protein